MLILIKLTLSRPQQRHSFRYSPQRGVFRKPIFLEEKKEKKKKGMLVVVVGHADVSDTAAQGSGVWYGSGVALRYERSFMPHTVNTAHRVLRPNYLHSSI